LALKNAGEERLLAAALNGSIPLGIAMDIAKTDSVETQRELLKAVENKQLNYVSIRAVKRLIEQRRFFGKDRRNAKRPPGKTRTSAEGLVNVYRRESQRQKLFIKKANSCETKLLFLVTAFNKLLADDHFVTLLQAESLSTMPKYLAEKLALKVREAA
jgi:ParB family chromosome partitioning protein